MEKDIFILRIILPAILAYIVFGMIYMLSSSDKQPNPEELNSTTLEVATELYLRDTALIECIDSIQVDNPGYYTLKGKVTGINTKDIPHVTESELDSIDDQFKLNNIKP